MLPSLRCTTVGGFVADTAPDTGGIVIVFGDVPTEAGIAVG